MSDIPASLSKLPPRCFAQLPSTGETVAIIRGETGYHPVVTVETVEQLNATLPEPPTPEQIEAMLVGSMFGWAVPAASPEGMGAAETDAFSPARLPDATTPSYRACVRCWRGSSPWSYMAQSPQRLEHGQLAERITAAISEAGT